MFGRHKESKKSANPIVGFFRLILSVVVFSVLIIGLYFAYKQFSGIDPLKIDPKNIAALVITNPQLQQFSDKIAEVFKIPSPLKLLGAESNQNTIPVPDNGLSSGLDIGSAVADEKKPQNSTGGPIDFSFILVSDSHNDNINLSKALTQAKEYNTAFIVGLGDFTQVGTVAELKNAKKEFDLSGIRYFLIPGDHDLWDSRDKGRDSNTNFTQVFGPTYQSFIYNGYEFILINNADNYIGINDSQNSWIVDILKKAKDTVSKGLIVLLHEPLYHPSSDHVMGKTDPKIESQAKALMYQFKEANVKMVFAGDVHYFTKYQDPGTNLQMVTAGAVTSTPNTQAPRFVEVNILKDGNIVVNDVEIK